MLKSSAADPSSELLRERRALRPSAALTASTSSLPSLAMSSPMSSDAQLSGLLRRRDAPEVPDAPDAAVARDLTLALVPGLRRSRDGHGLDVLSPEPVSS